MYINITSHPEIQAQIIKNSLSNGSINQSYIQNLSNLVQFMNRNLNYNTSMESYLYQLLNNKNITNIITSLENTTLTEKQMNDLLTYSISDHQYKITSVEDLNNIDKIRKQYCQSIMNNPYSTLDEIKDATLEAMYGISTRTARNIVTNFSEITKYPEIFGEETISIINGINRILSETDNAQLRGDVYVVSGESLAIDIVNFARRIRNLYLEEYNKVLFKPSKDNYIETKEGIDIYRTPEEWAMFIHSLGAFSGTSTLVPWNIPLTSYQNICMSFINNDYIATAPIHGLILGFTDFEAYSLLAMGSEDLGSNYENRQFASELFLLNAGNGQFFLPTDLITATEKIHTFNEVVFSRRGGEEKRQPAYAIYFCNEYDPNSPDFKNYLKKVEEFNKQQPEGKEISIVVIERK